jgi:hypothetical protein
MSQSPATASHLAPVLSHGVPENNPALPSPAAKQNTLPPAMHPTRQHGFRLSYHSLNFPSSNLHSFPSTTRLHWMCSITQHPTLTPNTLTSLSYSLVAVPLPINPSPFTGFRVMTWWPTSSPNYSLAPRIPASHNLSASLDILSLAMFLLYHGGVLRSATNKHTHDTFLLRL